MAKLGISDNKMSSVILAIIGKDVQKSGNNHVDQVLWSAYSVLFFTKKSMFIIWFNLQKNLRAGRYCFSPFDNEAVQFRGISNFQRGSTQILSVYILNYHVFHFPTESSLTSPHFTGEDTCASKRRSNFPKMTQLIGGKYCYCYQRLCCVIYIPVFHFYYNPKRSLISLGEINEGWWGWK